MTAKQALKERDQLREEQHRAREARNERAARAAELRAEAKPIPREQDRLLRGAARSGEAADVEPLDRKRAELEAEAERENAAARAAGEAAKAAERELVKLHHDRFPEFAEAAEELTQDAADKLAALQSEYQAAFDAIEAARVEWALLVKDRNSVVLAGLDPAQRAMGEAKRRSLSPPPPNPLSPPGEVFGAPPIRPAEVEPVEEAA